MIRLSMKESIYRLTLLLIVIGFGYPQGVVLASDPETIHMDIVSAPVVPNGIVASEPTEFNVLLWRDDVDPEFAFDPEVKGVQIPAGGRMEVELSGFVPNPDVAGFFTGRNLILTTAPQNPIRPPGGGCVTCGNWVATLSGDIITVTPNGGLEDDGLEGERAAELGFKVIHLRPDTNNRSHTGTPFYNGRAGRIGVVKVRIYDDEELIARGTARLRFPARVGKQVHLTNVNTRDDNAVNSNTGFQRGVFPGQELVNTSIPMGGSFADGAPYAPQFLIFASTGVHDRAQFPTGDTLPEPGGDSFIPFAGIDGVTIVPSYRHPRFARLIRNHRTVGRVILSGPGKRNGARILANPTPTELNGNGSVLSVPVRAGNKSGLYTVTVYMNGGGSATSTFIVDD